MYCIKSASAFKKTQYYSKYPVAYIQPVCLLLRCLSKHLEVDYTGWKGRDSCRNMAEKKHKTVHRTDRK